MYVDELNVNLKRMKIYNNTQNKYLYTYFIYGLDHRLKKSKKILLDLASVKNFNVYIWIKVSSLDPKRLQIG